MNAGAMWNYYMLQGGTNFGRTAGAGIATSYDYDAPISGTCETRLLQCHLILLMYSLPEPFIFKNEHFTKTDSGQT